MVGGDTRLQHDDAYAPGIQQPGQLRELVVAGK